MYKLFQLNYKYYDLEPYIDTHTMALHYLKHTKGYLDKLNELLEKSNFDYPDIEDLYFYVKDNENILFNLGGVLNHKLYFNSINSNPKKPEGLLLKKINDTYGNYEKFIEKFKSSALQLKGSGYTFLQVDYDGNIQIVNKTNQNSPLFDKHIPLLCIDLWEHAYYLNYKNDKNKYLENVLLLLDFNYANEKYVNILPVKM